MPLPQFRQFIVVNNSGQLLTFDTNGRINVKETAWHFNTTTGKIVYTQLPDDDLGFISGSSLADGAEIVGDIEINNTSNLFIGSQLQLEITHDEGTAAVDSFDLYMAQGDASGELETDGSGYASAEANLLFHVGSLQWDPGGLDDELMRSQVWSIGG